MNEVVERPVSSVAVSQEHPQARQLSVVEYAVQSGAPVAEVRALVELQIQMDNHKLAMRQHDDAREREMRAEAARNAYSVAMAAFKSEVTSVVRSKLITDGPLKNKKHADLFDVVGAATASLSSHGLSVSWETLEEQKDWIRIACRVKHVAGHSESVPFGGPVDTGPGRNAIQARKSTITYLERFTMLMALGLAEKDGDDDGAGGKQETTDITALLVGLGATTTSAAALAYWRVNKESLKDDWAAANRFKKAVAEHRTELERGAA